jgi:hypothetical protein
VTAAEVLQCFIDWNRYEEQSGAPQRIGTFFVEPLPVGHSAGEFMVRATNTPTPPPKVDRTQGINGEGI